jgi:hypothetical protein
MPRLAFTTFGVLHETYDHPQSKGFIDRIGETYAAADRSDGFITRSRRDISTWTHSWGEYVCPRFIDSTLQSRIAQTLSLWVDIESVFAYSYAAYHAEGMKQRKEWFRDPEYPNYAAWWVDDDATPTFAEATARLERLHECGSTPYAFSFKQPFDARGNPTSLDQVLVKQKMRINTESTPDGIAAK